MLRSSSFSSKAASWFALVVIFGALITPGVAQADPPVTPPPATTPPATAPTTPPATTVQSPADQAIAQPSETQDRPFRAISPNPAIPIPGVRFTPATEEGGIISVPYLAQYISGIYRLSVGLGAILAAIMIVYGGFRYMLSASAPGVSDGKTIIQDAFIGLVVLLSSFLILKTINPKLVEMNPIRISRVQAQDPEVIISQQLGASDGGGNTPVTLACFNGTGRYTARMRSVCPSKQIGSLNDVQKLEFLRQIVDVWKRIGIDEHGSIYVRGGSPSCSNVNVAHVQGKGHGNVVAGFLKRMERNVSLDQLNLSGNCVQSLRTHTGESDHGQPCYDEYWAAYNRVYMTRFRQAGVYCADCIANVRNIYACYGGGEYSTMVGAIPSRTCSNDNVFNFTGDETDAQITQGIAQLRFGDFIVDGSHAYLYTGKANLGYEIMEMGTTSGYSSESRPNRLAHSAPINYTQMNLQGATDSGGMAVYRSALPYLREKVNSVKRARREGRQRCVTALRVLRNIPASAHQSLAQSQLQPFQVPSIPASGNPQPSNGTDECSATPGAAQTSGPAGQPATSGAVTRTQFVYRPPSGDSGWQDASPSQLFFPSRIAGSFRAQTARPRIHLYIFLHGANSHGHTAEQTIADSDSWISSINRSLNEVAGSRNIVVAAPFYVGSSDRYMNRFNLDHFYQAAVTALGSSMSGFQASDIEDVVIGGHSAATCQGPGDPLLKQAISASLGGKRKLGIVAYDGCMSDSMFRPTNFETPSGVALLMNADIRSLNDGMGFSSRGTQLLRPRYSDIVRLWELPRMACPAYVPSQCPQGSPPVEPSAPDYNQRRCNACYGKRVDGKQIVLFQTYYGHRASVLHMTKFAFGAFYAN